MEEIPKTAGTDEVSEFPHPSLYPGFGYMSQGDICGVTRKEHIANIEQIVYIGSMESGRWRGGMAARRASNLKS